MIDGSDADKDGLLDPIDGDDKHFGSARTPIPSPRDKDGNFENLSVVVAVRFLTKS